MATYRAMLWWAFDSALPRDRVTVNPHFSGDNPGALADALMANMATIPGAGTMTYGVKIYDALKPKPNPPMTERQSGSTFSASTKTREVALCLSYYSTYNRPRYRGRLYVPGELISGSLGLRPSTQQITDALNFRLTLTTGLPPNTNWIVYSKTAGQSYGVSNCWVDDEWDIQRSRGLRGTTRQLANVP
jgi:hypothetical protein